MRTQCDVEKLYDSGGDKIEAAAAVTAGISEWAAKYNTIPSKVVAGVAELFAAGFGIWAVAIDAKRSRLSEGCNAEHAQALEEAGKTSGGGGGGGGGEGGYTPEVGVGFGRDCTFLTWSITISHGDGNWTVFGYSANVCFPIALDLDRDGIEYRTQDNPIYADLDLDGRYSNHSWIAPDDGLIVYDDNMDGIGQHHEWVLTSFVHGADTDLEALRAFDSDGNGALNANDELWSKLKVGQDINQNGKFDLGELQSFAAHGITWFNLEVGVTEISTPDDPAETQPGIFTFNTGSFVKDGAIHGFADVALEKRAFAEQVYSDADNTIVSYGGTQAWIHLSDVDASIDLATRTYEGLGIIDYFGGDGADFVSGSAGGNMLTGGGGVDSLFGLGGDDIIVADYLDRVHGTLRGGEGYDTIVFDAVETINIDTSATGFESVLGGDGNDNIWTSVSSAGTDGVMLAGGGGDDLLQGGEGHDTFFGGEGADQMVGYGGDDMFFIDAIDLAGNIVGGTHGAAGDTIFVEGDTDRVLVGMYAQGIENMHGGGGDDIIHASRNDAYFYQEKADNTLSGGAGDDLLFGGAGADTYLWQRGDGGDIEDKFIDRNYGETEGDFVSLGEGVALGDVSFTASEQDLYLTISSTDGGRILLRNFA